MSRKSEDGIVITRKRGIQRPRPPEPVRVFASLPLDDATRRRIDKVIDPVRQKLGAFRWTWPSSWHITLKFYGGIDPKTVPALEQALMRVASGPIDVEIRGMGGFPNLRDPRVLWVGLNNPDGRLAALHRRVQEISATLGYEYDRRKFHPHITVARVTEDRTHPVARELTPLMDAVITETRLESMVLYRSDLSERGAVYTPLHRFDLKG